MYHVLQMGMGPIGLAVSRVLLERKNATLVAGLDVDPELVGQDIGTLCHQGATGALVHDRLAPLLAEHRIDVAIVTTHSQASIVAKHITPLVEAGIPIITTCEELLYPFNTQPQLAKELDELAKKYNTSIVGTGVNPGFLMDHLPIIATGLSESISHITVNRIQDASDRRLPFQQKIGAGLSREEFDNKVNNGTLRHVGLKESVHLIASKLQLKLSKVTETISPVEKLHVIQGVHQQAYGYVGNTEVIKLNFLAAMHQKHPEDRIIVRGEPAFELSFSPPINGDSATAAISVNAIPSICRASPGLKTMSTIEPVSYWN